MESGLLRSTRNDGLTSGRFAGDTLELPLRARGGARRRHALRHCRDRLLDHADAGAGLSVRAEAGRADHGGRGWYAQPVADPGLVARGRLARLRRLFDSRHSGSSTRGAHAAGAAVARGRYLDRPVSHRDGAGAALARPAPTQAVALAPPGWR